MQTFRRHPIVNNAISNMRIQNRSVKIEYFPRVNLIRENFSNEMKGLILQRVHDEWGHIGIERR